MDNQSTSGDESIGVEVLQGRVDVANKVFIASLAVTAIAAVVVFVVSWLIIRWQDKISEKKDFDFARYKQDAQVQISTANKAASDANERAAKALSDAAHLGLTFNTLQQMVKDKEAEVAKQMTDFQARAEEQSTKNDKVIADLNSSRENLEKARTEAKGAAEQSQKTLAEMQKALDAEENLRIQMQTFLKPRQMSPEQTASLIDQLKPYAPTPFDVSCDMNVEAVDFARQIATALESSGWIWKEWKSGGALMVETPGKPSMGTVTAKGIMIQMRESDAGALTNPIVALAKALASTGLKININLTKNDQEPKSPLEKGMVHIIVGSKQ